MRDFIFFGFTITVDGDCRHEIKTLAPWKKSYEKLDIMLRSRGITLSTKVNIVKVMLFQAVMYGCEYLTTKKGWYQRTDILNYSAGEYSWDQESLIKEIKPVNPNRNQSWIFIGRTYAETKAPVLATWWEELTHWKRPWRWKSLRAGGEAASEDEMVR